MLVGLKRDVEATLLTVLMWMRRVLVEGMDGVERWATTTAKRLRKGEFTRWKKGAKEFRKSRKKCLV
jgi:hypothetical protein